MELGRQAADVGARQKSVGGSPFMQAWLTGSDTLPPSIENIRAPYAQHPTVYTAIKRKATAIGQLEVEVWPKTAKRGKDKPIEGHWLPELLSMPSPELRGEQLKEAVVTFLELTGESFLWHQDIRRGGAGKVSRPHALALLNPNSMWPHYDRDHEIDSWRYSSPKGALQVPLEELTFPHYFNPYDCERGLGPLRAAMVEYTGDHAAAVWNRSFIENSAIPPLLFSSPETDWLEEDRRAFIEDWHAKFGRPSRRGLAATLPKGVKPELLKITQAEMEFLMGRRFNREQILSVFGVPPAVAGVFDSPSYVSSPKEQIKFFWLVTLMPIVRYLEAVFTDLVQRYEPEVVVYFKTEPVMADIGAADFKEKVETASRLMSWGWSPASVNEALALGMPTADQPWLEEGYLPFSVVPARRVIAQADEESEDTEEEPEPLPDEPVEEEKVAGSPGGLLDLVKDRVQGKADDRAQRWSGLAARYGDIGRGYNRRLRSWLWEMRSAVLTNVRKLKAAVTVRRDAADDLLWDERSVQLKLKEISKRAWLQGLTRGAEVLKDETGFAVAFDLLDPRVTEYLSMKAVQIVKIEKRVREEVRTTLMEGIGLGENVEKLAARVRERFDVERSRALTIARTETAQSFSFGRFEGMKQAGIQKHEWLTSRDARVRDSHAAQDGEVAVIGEPFTNGARYAGDPQASPGEIINCRCVTVPIVTEN